MAISSTCRRIVRVLSEFVKRRGRGKAMPRIIVGPPSAFYDPAEGDFRGRHDNVWDCRAKPKNRCHLPVTDYQPSPRFSPSIPKSWMLYYRLSVLEHTFLLGHTM